MFVWINKCRKFVYYEDKIKINRVKNSEHAQIAGQHITSWVHNCQKLNDIAFFLTIL